MMTATSLSRVGFRLISRLILSFFISSSLNFNILFAQQLPNPLSARTHTSSLPHFNWSGIEPSSKLVWYGCYAISLPSTSTPDLTGQQPLTSASSSQSRRISSAHLLLPLDYYNTTNAATVSLALPKVSSASPLPSHHAHRGTIIAVPGGPGASRIKALLQVQVPGSLLDLLDEDHEYDFLTFDQRGIWYSIPSARCFGSVAGNRAWEASVDVASGVIRAGDEEGGGLGLRLAAARTRRQLGDNGEDGNETIKQHMSTAYVARDMLEILQKISDPDGGQRHPPKLRYIGFSYGTTLGLTFASLYRSHVSRMLLDGNIDGNDWVGKWQMKHLMDQDAVWSTFFTDCFEAHESCPLWRATDSAPVDIKRRVDGLLADIKKIPAYTLSDEDARLITYRDVRIAMVWATYVPQFGFPALAQVMNELLHGSTNVTLSFPFQDELAVPPCSEDEDDDLRAGASEDAGMVLNCRDAEDISNVTLSDFKDYLSALEYQSFVGAFFQGERRLRCLGWPMSLQPK